MAKTKYIESPEQLWQNWLDYKKSLPSISVPVTHPKLGVVNLDIAQPIHEQGFNRWMFENTDFAGSGVHQYFHNRGGEYDSYVATISRIKDDKFEHNYKYASAGLHKEKLTMSLLGMAEKTESKVSNSIQVLSLDPIDSANYIAQESSIIKKKD